MRLVVKDAANRTFVYPRSPGDPSAEVVRKRFEVTADGFTCALGRVDGYIYVGRTSAGGVGSEIDLDRDGKPDVKLALRAGFLVQLRSGRVIAAEADRDVIAEIQGRTVQLRAYTPVSL